MSVYARHRIYSGNRPRLRTVMEFRWLRLARAFARYLERAVFSDSYASLTKDGRWERARR